MAKMKVHELAKELNIQSKDVLTFLQGAGVEVKAAQSSLEDDMVNKVRGKFAGGGNKKNEEKENKSQGITGEKLEEHDNEIHKKKKNIIFVSNPYNSKMAGTTNQKPQTQTNSNNQKGSSTSSGSSNNQYKPANNQQVVNRPLIKPTTPPSQPTASNIIRGSQTTSAPVSAAAKTTNEVAKETSAVQPKIEQSIEKQVVTDKAMETVVVKSEDQKTAATETVKHTEASAPARSQSSNSNYQGQRPQGTGYQGNNSNYQGQRPQGTGYQGNNSNYQGQRPQGTGYQGNNSNYQGQRPQGTGYQGNNSNYQGQRPQGTGYQGNNSQGNNSNYQGQRPQGTGYQGNNSNYQGQRPQGTGYQGNNSNYQGQRPQGTGYQGNNSNYQGQRPQGTGYQGTNSNYQGQRPQGTGYQGNNTGGYQGRNAGTTGAPGQNRTYGQKPYTQGSGSFQRGGTAFGGNKDKDDDVRENRFAKKTPVKSDGPSLGIEKHRDDEKRRISQEKDKRNKKDLVYEEEVSALNKNKAGRFIKPEKKQEATEEQIKVIVIPELLTIKELAEKMKLQPSAIVKKLFLKGQIVTVNQEISYEDAENIAIEYDIICEKEAKIDVIEELLKEDDENEEEMIQKPPVICVMGHVDHGKTSLLDAIRKTNVTDKESGGITQHIGAYTVSINNKKITFLDTPGHEAFTSMRMRGASSTDIAVLVVAADDGVMPQTVEAISHAKAAGIEIIVAVNKIDKPNANIERVKQELTEYELVSEDWGGTTVFAPVSAKTGEGIEQLLEMITLTADILELKANPNRKARGLVIEAELDKGRGPVATVLVQKGTLHVGDFISAGSCYGKVRAMVDDKGRRVKEALPSTPVEILGLNDVPNAGEVFIAHDSDKNAKSFAETFVSQNKEKMLEDTKAKLSLDDLFTKIQAGNLKELNLIVKADVQGSVEAVKQSLLKLSNEEVVVKCLHGGVGAINESDVILASASSAIIIGFNVRPDVAAKATAEREGVDLRLYKVIYKAIEDIEAAMKGMLDPVYEEKIIGHAEIRQIFKASAIGNIAGSYIMDGNFQRNCKVRITRQGKLVFEGPLRSLKREKEDVKEVKAGFECGMLFEGFDQMQEFDVVEAYIMVEVPR